MDEEAWVYTPEYLSSVEGATLPVAAPTAWHAIVELAACVLGRRS
ncbi:hypothetical protein PAMC26577_40540 [Caballeronia sordidicola]|uniref:Uncharacterized protein n=2 Tax=Caballeronia sordidicola TaxID=196367 RepID=A0A242M2C8_CABSO|nr:hypothetical protein PAMC26577_40540 [Caballeronia sordidicola]